MLDSPVIVTPRLVLRPLVAEDAAALHDCCYGDSEVMRYWDLSPSRDAKQTAARIAQSLSIDPAWHAIWVASPKGSDNPIGMMNYNHREPAARRLEVGYALARSHRRQGYMAEAMRGFLQYCFDELATHRVEALVDQRNEESIQFTEGLCFRREGLLRDRICIAGEYRSLLMYALLEDEWRARTVSGGARIDVEPARDAPSRAWSLAKDRVRTNHSTGAERSDVR